jgi:hypothetical protein
VATKITTRAEWESAIKDRRCVLFVDCRWNVNVARFRRRFTSLASWCQEMDVTALTMQIDPEHEDDVWKICAELWTKNNIDPGGLKNWGGAGRVVWLDHGRVVDHAWCMEFLDNSQPESVDTLAAKKEQPRGEIDLVKARTEKAFK